MPRKSRNYQTEKSLVFHIINRGVLKQTIFHDDMDYTTYIKSVSRYITEAGASVYHWCLMNNHYHVLLELPDSRQLSKVVGGWQQVYAVSYHHRHNTAGRFFQSRFKSQAIEKEKYLLACGRYIEQNPVRAGLCDYAWEWPWSSARFYVERETDPLVTCKSLWVDIDGEAYKQWLEERSSEDEKLFSSTKNFIGGSQVRGELVRKSGRFVRRRKGRRLKGLISS